MTVMSGGPVSPEQIDKYSTVSDCSIVVPIIFNFNHYPRLVLLFEVSQTGRPTSSYPRTRQLRPLLTPCEAVWPTMMMLSKLSRASTVRLQQPLFRPRFTIQSFQRSVHSPRSRAKDTNLPNSPARQETSLGRFIAEIIFFSALVFVASGFSSGVKYSAETEAAAKAAASNKPNRNVTPGQDVVANGSEETSEQRDRKRADARGPPFYYHL
jgi:hypothetical protein